GLGFARPEKVRPVGLAEQTKEQHRIVFRKHVVRETASLNRWTLQQALQQLFVLLTLSLRSRHALSVEAQLADHFRLGLHPIDFSAQHLFGTPLLFCFTHKPRASLDYLPGNLSCIFGSSPTKFTEPEKAFLCMDLSRRTRTQNR